MPTQPEAILEENLVKQLARLGYIEATIRDEESLLANLKTQLGAFNGTAFSDKEFDSILNHLANRKEVIESTGRIEKIVDYIITHHNQKTHQRGYSAIFAVNSIEMLIKYYEETDKPEETAKWRETLELTQPAEKDSD